MTPEKKEPIPEVLLRDFFVRRRNRREKILTP